MVASYRIVETGELILGHRTLALKGETITLVGLGPLSITNLGRALVKVDGAKITAVDHGLAELLIEGIGTEGVTGSRRISIAILPTDALEAPPMRRVVGKLASVQRAAAARSILRALIADPSVSDSSIRDSIELVAHGLVDAIRGQRGSRTELDLSTMPQG
jgi:hypothetical protein